MLCIAVIHFFFFVSFLCRRKSLIDIIKPFLFYPYLSLKISPKTSSSSKVRRRNVSPTRSSKTRSIHLDKIIKSYTFFFTLTSAEYLAFCRVASMKNGRSPFIIDYPYTCRNDKNMPRAVVLYGAKARLYKKQTAEYILIWRDDARMRDTSYNRRVVFPANTEEVVRNFYRGPIWLGFLWQTSSIHHRYNNINNNINII